MIHLQQIVRMCEAHPVARKVIFVPRKQLAIAVRDALHRRGQGAIGLACMVVNSYAESVARLSDGMDGSTPLSPAASTVLLDEILQTLDAPLRAPLEVGESVRHVAAPMARTIQTFRQNAIAPDDLDALVDARADRQALKASFARYEARLAEGGLHDAADVLRWATDDVQSGRAPFVDDTVYAIYDAVDLPHRAYKFVDALRSHAAAFYRIGGAEGGATPPPQCAARRFPTAPVPSVDALDRTPDRPAGLDPDDLAFRTAIGAAQEVRSVYQEILDREIPLDDVEIAFPAGERYRTLLAGVAESLAIPISLSTGRPATATRPGQALAGFYDWTLETYDAARLIWLLRAGLIRPSREAVSEKEVSELDLFGDAVGRDDVAEWISPTDAARLLAQKRYESERNRGRKNDAGGYDKAFEQWVTSLTREISRHESTGADASRLHAERGKVLRLWIFVRRLRHLSESVGTETSLARLAGRSLTFLDQFGPPIEDHEDIPEEDHTRDQAADRVIRNRLDTLQEEGAAQEEKKKIPTAKRDVILRILRDELANDFVQALRPLPGRAHVVPFDSAGYTGRTHLFVVGMDADSVATTVTEDALLLDVERERLAERTGAALPRMQDAADHETWRVVQSLWRHGGPTTFLTRRYDVENGEELFPSSLFLRLRQFAHPDGARGVAEDDALPCATLRPDPAGVRLDDRASWLSVRPGASPSPGVTATVRDALRERYAGLAHGDDAVAARTSDVYTAFDGLLAPGPYPELDLLNRDAPVSATQLELLAEAPYVYFLRYVLGVRPLDEPALDDTEWLDRLQTGDVLHRTFETFMRSLDGATPTPEHEAQLIAMVDVELDEEEKRLAPPSDHVRDALERSLKADARVFLQAEIAHAADGYAADEFELGFGFEPHRATEVKDQRDVTVRFDAADVSVSLRGRVDRVDRTPDGARALWDYKTGSSRHYDASDPLQDGVTMQWALYAYALDALEPDAGTVAEAGYFFTSRREMGKRLRFDPGPYRDAVGALVKRLAATTRDGAFPMHPRLHNARAWRYGDYDRIVPDRSERKKELAAKTYPDGRATPLFAEPA